MMTITQAFEQLRQNLELTEAERNEASRQQNVVRNKLDLHLGGIERDLLSGSYSRRTAIRPLDDIDIFLVLDTVAHRDVYPSSPPQTSPLACLEKVKRALDKAYQQTIPSKLQGRSVNIEFKGTGIGYDVVPAFAVRDGNYMIPDRGRQSWICTNPEKHREACVKANERAGDKLNPLIKMAKQWNRLVGNRLPSVDKPLRSFHLEVMAYEAFSAPPASYPQGLQALFAFLAGRVLSRCPEPAGVGPHVDADMTPPQRDRAHAELKKAAEQAPLALQLDSAGRTEEAHGIWRSLLGDVYPEKGRTKAR